MWRTVSCMLEVKTNINTKLIYACVERATINLVTYTYKEIYRNDL
jgi:hypothetical protein